MAKQVNIQDWVNRGFNKTQATSLAWVDHFQDYMDRNAYKGNSFFGVEIRIDTFCYDCNKGGQFLPSTVRDFISMHKNHKTKTIKLR